MTQYIVTTKEGKIIDSKPSLPISDEVLQTINDSSAQGLYRAIQQHVDNLVHCEVVNINWEKDIVDHVLIQA